LNYVANRCVLYLMNDLGIGWEGIADVWCLPLGRPLYRKVFRYIGRLSSLIPQSWREWGWREGGALCFVPKLSQNANASSVKRH
jgi:hypothetical protein